MHIATIRRRHGDRVYESHLIRRSVREGKRGRHETIANVSKPPPATLDALRRALAGQSLVGADEAFDVERSLPHGHVAQIGGAPRLVSGSIRRCRRNTRRRNEIVAAWGAQAEHRQSSECSKSNDAEAKVVKVHRFALAVLRTRDDSLRW